MRGVSHLPFCCELSPWRVGDPPREVLRRPTEDLRRDAAMLCRGDSCDPAVSLHITSCMLQCFLGTGAAWNSCVPLQRCIQARPVLLQLRSPLQRALVGTCSTRRAQALPSLGLQLDCKHPRGRGTAHTWQP